MEEGREEGPICDPVTNLLHFGSREGGRESQWHEAAAALVVWMNAQIGVE